MQSSEKKSLQEEINETLNEYEEDIKCDPNRYSRVFRLRILKDVRDRLKNIIELRNKIDELSNRRNRPVSKESWGSRFTDA